MSQKPPPSSPRRPNSAKGRQTPSSPSTRTRRLALLGVAGESVGVVAGATQFRLSGEPAWLVMAAVSLALALLLLRRV